MDQLLNLSFWMWWLGAGADYTRAWWSKMPRKQVSSDTHAEKR